MKIKTNVLGKHIEFISETKDDAYNLGRIFGKTIKVMRMGAAEPDELSISVDVCDVIDLLLKK